MVFNIAAALAVAEVSTDTWQLIWRVPPSQRMNTQELIDMAFCLPMHQLSRIVLCLWTFMCLPSSSDSFYSYNYDTLSSSDDGDDDDRLAFEHNLYSNRDYYDSDDDDDDDDDDGSSSSFYDHYSHSDCL